MSRHLIETKVQISTLRSLGKSWGDIEKNTGVRRSTAQAIVAKTEKLAVMRIKSRVVARKNFQYDMSGV